MTKHDWASLAVRILALHALLSALNESAPILVSLLVSPDFSATSPFGPPPPWQRAISLLARPFTQGAAAIFLWLFADGIAAALAGPQQQEKQQESAPSALNFAEGQTLVFRGVGLFVLVTGAENFVAGVIAWAQADTVIRNVSPFPIGPLVAMGIGLYLLIGWRGAAKTVAAARDWRDVGRDPTMPTALERPPREDQT